MAQVIVDFDKLKFNLYEILGVEKNATESKIKKAFRNLILNFHPDKNNDVEEDIYYHIITANQILSNKEYRDKYDNFLNKSVNYLNFKFYQFFFYINCKILMKKKRHFPHHRTGGFTHNDSLWF